MKTDDLLKQANENRNQSSINFAEKCFEKAEDAKRVFAALKTMILRIDEWNVHSLISTFELFDKNGKQLENGKLAVGLCIRIALRASGKYDWIHIENMFETANEFIITVKPCFDPTDENRDEKTISHFFTDDSTNNFCIYKKDKTVAFYVIGLGEKMNTNETSGALETVRNAAVNFGTYLGIQSSEWGKFSDHFLADAAEEN